MSFSCPDLTFSWTRTIFEAYRHSMAPLRWEGCHQWKRVSLYISSYILLWTTACWQNYHVIISLNDIKLRYQPGRGAGTWGSGNSVGGWRRWWQGGENNEYLWKLQFSWLLFVYTVCFPSDASYTWHSLNFVPPLWPDVGRGLSSGLKFKFLFKFKFKLNHRD